MSAKTILKSYQVVLNGNMTSNITSPPTNIQMLDNTGYSIAFSGTPTGTFSVQCSADYQPGTAPTEYPMNPGTWTTLPLSNPITAAGSPDNGYIDLTLLSAPWIRLVYTASSGSDSLQVWVTGKSLS
jgi:hypothetical protein